MSYGQARYFNNFGFKFIHLLADEKNYFCFTFLKLFDDFSSAQSCLRTFINKTQQQHWKPSYQKNLEC